MTTLLTAVLFLLLTTLVIRQTKKPKKKIIIHLLLLLITPWFLLLLIAKPTLKEIPALSPKFVQIGENISVFSSGEFLFFHGDVRPIYSIKDYGVILLSFLPSLVVGINQTIKKRSLINNIALGWLFLGWIIAVTFSNVAGLPGSLWFLPALSILATIGANELIRIRSYKKTTIYIKQLIVINFFWIIYESIRLYHVIIVHQPFNQ